MPLDRARYYSAPAILGQYHESGQERGRSDLVLSDGLMPMSTGWAKYRRFHPDEAQVFVTDLEGKGHWISERQHKVYTLAMAMVEGDMLTMRGMAIRLGVAPSTVSRALTKLSAWGILCYIVGRGRYAGLVIIKRVKGDGLDRFRKAAKARVRRWSQYAADRVSRLKFNVATRYTYEEVRSHGYEHVYGDVMNATLIREWSPDELRDAGII